jgi:hypothetical protein
VDLSTKFMSTSQIDILACDSDIEIYLKSKISTNNRMSLFTATDDKLEEDIVKNLNEEANSM